MRRKHIENTVRELQTLDFLNVSWLFLVFHSLSLINLRKVQILADIYTSLSILRGGIRYFENFGVKKLTSIACTTGSNRQRNVEEG